MNATHGVDAFIVRELVRRCSYDREHLQFIKLLLEAHEVTRAGLSRAATIIEQAAKNHNFISLRGIEFITEKSILDFSMEYRKELLNLINETLAKPSFDVICIHDEMKCHPKYMNYLRECYMTILAELADSTVGQQIIRELRNDPTYILEKLSNDLGDEIMKAEYFLS